MNEKDYTEDYMEEQIGRAKTLEDLDFYFGLCTSLWCAFTMGHCKDGVDRQERRMELIYKKRRGLKQ